MAESGCGIYEKSGRLKRRVAVAMVMDALNMMPCPLPGGWGGIMADAACFGTSHDVSCAAHEGRKIIAGGKPVVAQSRIEP